MNVIKEYAKTIAAWFAGIVTTMIVNLVSETAVWPQTRDEWLRYLVTSFGAALAVWAARNKITQSQLDKDKNVIGGTVVSDRALKNITETVAAPEVTDNPLPYQPPSTRRNPPPPAGPSPWSKHDG